MPPAGKGRPGQARSAPARVRFASSAASCARHPVRLPGNVAGGGKHARRAQRNDRRGISAQGLSSTIRGLP